jgi:hypothetical protein
MEVYSSEESTIILYILFFFQLMIAVFFSPFLQVQPIKIDRFSSDPEKKYFSSLAIHCSKLENGEIMRNLPGRWLLHIKISQFPAPYSSGN